ncbi:unnamed protein product [Urochloa humidicola]
MATPHHHRTASSPRSTTTPPTPDTDDARDEDPEPPWTTTTTSVPPPSMELDRELLLTCLALNLLDGMHQRRRRDEAAAHDADHGQDREPGPFCTAPSLHGRASPHRLPERNLETLGLLKIWMTSSA